MPSLLEIPLEVRECIIQHVLFSHRTPPDGPPSKDNRVDFQDVRYNAWRAPPHGIYSENHCPSNSISLLLTNQQLSAETKAVINRMKSTDYILDISFLNDVDLFPTWILVPYLTNRVTTLYADVRLFGHIVSSEIARGQSGDGGILGFHWSFYALLERFLRYGPVAEKDMPGLPKPRSKFDNPTFADCDVTVKLLVLNFSSAERERPFPPSEVEDGDWETQHFWNRHVRDDINISMENYATRPEWPAEFLESQIDALLRMNSHTAGYGKILYERIGSIHILVDGELKHEVDLASRLVGLKFTDPSHTFGHLFHREERIPAFWDWKKKTLERREKLGFPVVWPEDDPEVGERLEVDSISRTTRWV